MSFYGLEVIQASHVLAMASLGISKVLVARPVRVRILSTGSELASHDSNFMEPSRIMDSNGTFITVVLSMIVIDTRFVRITGDDRRQISNIVRDCCHCESFDVLITTGTGSAGNFDYVRAAIEDIGAEIQFHKLAIRPGHPVLFATFRQNTSDNEQENMIGDYQPSGQTAIFGLPGNPIAAAACLKFLVMPYLRVLRGMKPEAHILARVGSSMLCNSSSSDGAQNKLNSDKCLHLDLFRLRYVCPGDFD